MFFNYDDPIYDARKKDSKGNVMRECPNCKGRTIMSFRKYQYAQVECEYCGEITTRFDAKSLDDAMKKWNSGRVSKMEV